MTIISQIWIIPNLPYFLPKIRLIGNENTDWTFLLQNLTEKSKNCLFLNIHGIIPINDFQQFLQVKNLKNFRHLTKFHLTKKILHLTQNLLLIDFIQ